MKMHIDSIPRFSGRSSSWLLLFVLALASVQTTAQELRYPVSIAVHPSGTVYLADRNLPGVWRLEGDVLSVFFQASKKSRTPLSAIRCLALDSEGKLLAGDSSTRDVYRFDEKGTPQPLTAQGRALGQIRVPMDIVVGPEADILVSDLETDRIVKVPAEGGHVEPFVSIRSPRGMFHDSQKQLWVISGRRLVRFSEAGEKETIVEDGVFEFPQTVVVGEDGVVYVCDSYAAAIWRVVPGQDPEVWVRGDPLVHPVAMDRQEDRLLVVDPRARAVFAIDAQGTVTRREARLANP
jgi:sugar lactone lactonase YvrE